MQQACPSGLCSASQENRKRGSAPLGQAQPGRLKAGSSARDAPSETGRDHRDHHAGNRLAAPLGPRLFDGGGAHQARPDARLREDRRSARLPHRGERCLAEAQRQAGPQGGVTGMPRPSFDREAIEAEIDRVRLFGLDELRTLWRVTFRSSPPPAFTKDLMARFLCWHIQEQAQGGLDPETAKHLDGRARGDKRGANRPRRLKPPMMSAVAPIWDGNETWLVVTAVILWGAFPVAYAGLLSAFYLPLLIMLAELPKLDAQKPGSKDEGRGHRAIKPNPAMRPGTDACDADG